MDQLLNNCEPYKDLEQFETKYNNEIKLEGLATAETQFEYAYCLVHSIYKNDIKKGILLFENLAATHSDGKRDYIYYLAFGNARIKNYGEALNYCRAFLEIESTNDQVRLLEQHIKTQSSKDIAKGVAVAGGAALVVGGILGFALKLLIK